MAFTQPKKQSNWLLDLLPFLGGVGGGVLGGVAGGGFGAIPGGAAGAGGGELLKQLLLKQQLNVGAIKGEAQTGAIGGLLGGVTGKVFGKVAGAATKYLPERLMGSVFKEAPTAARAAVQKGTQLGKEALKRGIKGSDESIYANAVGRMTQLEELMQTSLSTSNKSVSMQGIKNLVKPLLKSLTDAGNLQAVKSITNRVANIEAVHGKSIPVAVAQKVKRTLYDELRKNYGKLAGEETEALKTVARGLKEGIAKNVKGVGDINKELSVYGRVADSIEKKIASGASKNLVGLKDILLGGAGYGLGGIPGLVGAGAIKGLESTVGKTYLSNILSGVGKSGVAQAGGNVLSQILGQTGARVPSAIQGITPEQPGAQQQEGIQHDQIIPQQPTQEPILSPEGQWQWDEAQQDWVPNEQKQTGGFTKEQIGQAMVLDLARTGGKNIPELKAISEFLVDKDKDKKKPLTSVQQTLITNVQSAERSLNKVEEILKKDPNIILKSQVPGIAGRLLGASTYNTARKEISDVLGRMRTGAVITEEELKLYLTKLPELGDRQEDIDFKLKELRFIFDSLRERIEEQSGADFMIQPQATE